MVEGRAIPHPARQQTGPARTRSRRTGTASKGPPPPARVPLDDGPPVRVPAATWSRVRAGLVLDAFERDRHTVHVVCGDRLDPRAVVRASRRAGHRPRDVLATSYVARAFTAAQLQTLVHDRLAPRVHGAHALTLADPLAMLVTEEVRFAEARTILVDLLDRLGRVDVPVLVTQRRRDTPLADRLTCATRRARLGVHDVTMPAGRVGERSSASSRPRRGPPSGTRAGPSRQTTLDAYRPAVGT